MDNRYDMHRSARPHAGGRIAIFAGPEGRQPAYQQAAGELGRLLAEEELEVLIGEVSGLARTVAEAAQAGGGNVTSVALAGVRWGLPPAMGRWEVRSIAERKLLLISKADAVLALPGGLTTLAELLEVMTLIQQGERKLLGLLNIAAFYLPFLGLLDHLHQEHMTPTDPRNLLLVDRDPASLLRRILADERWLFASPQRREPERRTP